MNGDWSAYWPLIVVGALAVAVLVACLVVQNAVRRRDELRRAIFRLTDGGRWRGETEELRRLVRIHGLIRVRRVTVSVDAAGKLNDNSLDDDDAADAIGRIVGARSAGEPRQDRRGWSFYYDPSNR